MTSTLNVGVPERWVALLGGGAMMTYGLSRKTPGGLGLTLAGGALLYRGVTGHCPLYEAMGVNTANVSGTKNMTVPHHQGFLVEKSVTLMKSPEELYRFWRQLENLPSFMTHLESVTVTGDKRSHWVAKAPAGRTVEWDAEIINEEENKLIAWRSLEGAEINNAGSVRFQPAPGGRGTGERGLVPPPRRPLPATGDGRCSSPPHPPCAPAGGGGGR
ncbi:MAG: DUF2892 domain-containing protein, partial [Armatimonadetes bacterium]|nr:DUF2892 domain-containing protein [Armatimonadota bacterium]